MDNQQPIEQKNPQPSVRLIGFGQLIDQTWAIYKKRFIIYFLIALIPGLISYLLSFIPLAWSSEKNTDFFSLTNSLPTVSGSSVAYSMTASILISLVSSLLSLIGYAALIYIVKNNSEKINIQEALKKALKKTPQLIWVSILFTLISFGGFGLFVVPGIYFTVALVFSIFIVVSEDKKGMEALITSKFYVKNNWWQVFWRFFFLGIVTIVIGLIPLGIIFILRLSVSTFSAFTNIFTNISGLFSLIFNTLWLPFVIIFTFLLYQSLREQKQGANFDEAKKSKNLLVVFAVLGLIFFLASFSLSFINSWFVPKI